MRVAEHLTKAERIERSMVRKLHRDADYEMVVEACMLAGTHLLNAVLHHKGLTAETADLLHSDKPPLGIPLPHDIGDMMAALKVIEDLRPGYLRGVRPWEPAHGETCLRRLAEVRSAATKVLEVEVQGGDGR